MITRVTVKTIQVTEILLMGMFSAIWYGGLNEDGAHRFIYLNA